MDYKNLEMLSWLVAQFRRAGETGITFDQLIDKLVDEPNMEKIMPKRTFHNYLKELRDRFGIKIECVNRLQHEVGKKACRKRTEGIVIGWWKSQGATTTLGRCRF